MYLCYMKLEGYSDYEIYPETGQIWSYKHHKFIGKTNKSKYNRIFLTNDKGDRKIFSVHRLIWFAVNGSIPDGMQVNHIDENKYNNSISNLSLVDCKTNINWGSRNLRSSMKNTNHPNKSKMVVALKNGELKMCFSSIMEANRNGYCKSNIIKCCKYKYKTTGGYQWKYLDDYLGDLLEQIQNEDMTLEKAS